MQKYRDRNARCIAIPSKSIGVRGRFDSPETRKLAELLPRLCAKGVVPFLKRVQTASSITAAALAQAMRAVGLHPAHLKTAGP